MAQSPVQGYHEDPGLERLNQFRGRLIAYKGIFADFPNFCSKFGQLFDIHIQKSVFYTTDPMKNLNHIIVLALLFLLLAGTACTAAKKSDCGCPSKKGMVGY